MIIARQSTARTVMVGPVLDADGVAVTDCVVADFEGSVNGGDPAALNGSATLTHRGVGFYSLALTATDLGTVGSFEVTINDTVNACPMKEITVVEEAVYDALYVASATGMLPANVIQLLGTAWLVPGTAGTPDVNVKLISSDATAADNAEAFFDGTGYAGTNNVIPTVTTVVGVTTVNGLAAGVITATSIASDAITAAKIADGAIDSATFAAGAINAAAIADAAIDTATFAGGTTIPRVTLADTLTTYTGNTPQTGDSYARIGAAGASLTDLGGMSTTMKAQVQTEAEDAIVAHRLDELLNADSDIDGAAPPTVGSVFHELMSKTAGSFTFDQTTDSNEAIRDRGDSAWITATGFSTHSAADVWAAGTRTLTAGTNIALAKGTGVTGFTDLSAADVRTAVGLASANLDTQLDALPTAVENADALLGRNVAGGSSTGRTVSQALYVLRNKVAIVAGTMTVYSTDDVTSSWTATMTSDAAAEPITVMDPA